MGTKVGRNEPCPCGSGKKYKHCCLNKQSETRNTSSRSLVQVFAVLQSALESQSAYQNDESKKIKIKRINIINDVNLLCEFYPHSNKSIGIRQEIAFIVSFLSSFCKDNPHVPDSIQNFAVRAYSDDDDELMYALSSYEAANYIAEGKPIEWLQNTIFQDNSEDHRVTIAKRQISEIEIALREVIIDVLSTKHGSQWWNLCLDKKIRRNAEKAYESQTGMTSMDGSKLVSYTYLLGLKKIITENWPDFSSVFMNQAKFEGWLDALNSIRREEAHNRPITTTHIQSLKQIYNSLLGIIGKQYPEFVQNFILENWRERSQRVIQDYQQQVGNLEIGNHISLSENIINMKMIIKYLGDIEVRLQSIPVPHSKNELHDEMLNLLRNLRLCFEDMVGCAQRGNVTGVEKAARNNEIIGQKIRSLAVKIMMS